MLETVKVLMYRVKELIYNMMASYKHVSYNYCLWCWWCKINTFNPIHCWKLKKNLYDVSPTDQCTYQPVKTV